MNTQRIVDKILMDSFAFDKSLWIKLGGRNTIDTKSSKQ